MDQMNDSLLIDVSYDFFTTGHTDVQILQRTNINDLKIAYGTSLMDKLEQMLSEEVSKMVDKEIIKGLQKAIFDSTKEERKINAKRRIILNRLFNPPPEYFKNY